MPSALRRVVNNEELNMNESLDDRTGHGEHSMVLLSRLLPLADL